MQNQCFNNIFKKKIERGFRSAEQKMTEMSNMIT